MADPATSVPFTVAATCAIDGDTELDTAMTLGPDEPDAVRSVDDRTVVGSVTGLPPSSDRRPSAATAPSDSADPISAATRAMAHVFAAAPTAHRLPFWCPDRHLVRLRPIRTDDAKDGRREAMADRPRAVVFLLRIVEWHEDPR